MATKIGLRRTWFQVHKWIGITLAILIVPLSLSGAALVWHDALDAAINPQRHVAGPAKATLSPDAYAAAARAALAPGDRLASLRYPEAAGEAVVASAARPSAPGARARPGPPQRTMLWLDPASGRVLDKASSGAGLVRFLHVLHGSLQIPGVGRQIVGWIGVAMFLSCVSGLWLWWPTVGAFARGLRWRRQTTVNANLHHQLGFWIALPLAMLSFTGVWIAFFAALSGGGGGRGGGGGGGEAMARFRAQPVAETRMTPSQALAAAQGQADGAPVAITWPTDRDDWRVSFRGGDRPVEIAVDDETGEAERARRGGGQSGTARLMRRLHDGTGMGPVWQAVIFVGGIVPAILAVTGLIMWWRTRGWRAAVKRRQRARAAVPAE